MCRDLYDEVDHHSVMLGSCADAWSLSVGVGSVLASCADTGSLSVRVGVGGGAQELVKDGGATSFRFKFFVQQTQWTPGQLKQVSG